MWLISIFIKYHSTCHYIFKNGAGIFGTCCHFKKLAFKCEKREKLFKKFAPSGKSSNDHRHLYIAVIVFELHLVEI